MEELKAYQLRNCQACKFADPKAVGTGEPCCQYPGLAETDHEKGVCLTFQPIIRKENKSGKRIIAIAVSPKAYDEILTLKGERTWTKWLLELMLLEKPGHEVLYAELSDLVKPKTEKPKAEKQKVVLPQVTVSSSLVDAVVAEAQAIVEEQETGPEPKLKKTKAKAKAKPLVYDEMTGKVEAEPGVKYGYPDEKTGGTPVDISQIGKHKVEAEV